jgi:hypothetical protein
MWNSTSRASLGQPASRIAVIVELLDDFGSFDRWVYRSR